MKKLTPAKLEKFKQWLTAHGASVLSTTNEWELVRWTGVAGTCVIYFNKKGDMTMQGEALKTFYAYVKGENIRINPRTKKKKMSPVVRSIRDRDGDCCFYCHKVVWDDEAESVEHLVSQVHGGPNHISNLVLAHVKCNARAGHLPVIEKVKLREHNRKEKDHGSTVQASEPDQAPADGGA